MKKICFILTFSLLGNPFCKASSINEIIKYCRNNIELNTSLGHYANYNVPDEIYYAKIDGDIFEISYLHIDNNSYKKESYTHKTRIDLSKAMVYYSQQTSNSFSNSHYEYEIQISTFGNQVFHDVTNNTNSKKYSNQGTFFKIGCKDLNTVNQIIAPLRAATKLYRPTYSNTEQGCKQAYSQLISSFTAYKIKTENAKKLECATTTISSVTYKKGYLTISLVDKRVNCGGGGFVSGRYSLTLKISDLYFRLFCWYGKSTLYLCSKKDGIEFKTPSGAEIITQYGFEGTNMVMEKIYRALASFQDVVLESDYMGTLGGGSSSSANKQSTNSNKSESITKKVGKYVQ